jgi:predicted dehydrogenase
MNKSKVIVVGPGLIGSQHIRLINENPLSELCAIVAPDTDINRTIAAHHQVPLFYNLHDCFNLTQGDAVIVSSPNEFHAEQGLACVEAGMPVLIEKPITSNLEDAVHLVERVKQLGAKVLIGHHRTHSPIMKVARDIISSGQLGRIVSVMGSAQFLKPDHYFEDGPWRRKIGGGPILINLIHEIGNLRSLFGEITAVQAISSSAVRRFEVEDTVAINFIFDGGVLGTFLLSDTAAMPNSWELTSGENSSYPFYPAEDCYSVGGTHGSLAVPSMRLKLYSDGTPPSWCTPFIEKSVQVNREDPLKCQYSHFLDIIRNGVTPLVSALDGLRNLQVVNAIKISSNSNKLIPLDYNS